MLLRSSLRRAAYLTQTNRCQGMPGASFFRVRLSSALRSARANPSRERIKVHLVKWMDQSHLSRWIHNRGTGAGCDMDWWNICNNNKKERERERRRSSYYVKNDPHSTLSSPIIRSVLFIYFFKHKYHHICWTVHSNLFSFRPPFLFWQNIRNKINVEYIL